MNTKILSFLTILNSLFLLGIIIGGIWWTQNNKEKPQQHIVQVVNYTGEILEKYSEDIVDNDLSGINLVEILNIYTGSLIENGDISASESGITYYDLALLPEEFVINTTGLQEHISYDFSFSGNIEVADITFFIEIHSGSIVNLDVKIVDKDDSKVSKKIKDFQLEIPKIIGMNIAEIIADEDFEPGEKNIAQALRNILIETRSNNK